MTTYNTGNALGSTAAKDLYDNAQNMDYAMNAESPSWRDRFNKLRQSWAGMEMAANSNLLASGLTWVGDYATGLQLTARNQYFVKDGARYRIAPGAALPHTLTGAWATDQPNTVLIGDERLEVRVSSFGAVGDGVVNDTAAWNECRDYVGAIGGRMVIDGAKRYFLPMGFDLSGFSNMDVVFEPGATLWVGTPTLNMHAIRGYNCDNIKVIGAVIECVPVVRTAAVFAVYFHLSTFIVVGNCRMYDFLSNCWFYGCSDSHMYNNDGYRTVADGYHMSHGCRYCSMVENRTHEAKDDHYSVTTYVDTSLPGNADQRAKHIRIINNSANGGTWGNGVSIYGADDVLIAGNLIRDVARNGIAVMAFSDPLPSSDITILGNKIRGTASALKVPVSEATGGDPASDPLTGPADSSGICLMLCTDVEVKNNVIKNVVGASPAVKSGVFLSNHEKVTVADNTFDSIDGVGIYMPDGYGIDLTANNNNFRNISNSVLDIYGMTGGTLMVKGNTASTPYGTGSGLFMRFTNMTIKIDKVGNVGADPTKTTSVVSCPNFETNYNVPA